MTGGIPGRCMMDDDGVLTDIERAMSNIVHSPTSRNQPARRQNGQAFPEYALILVVVSLAVVLVLVAVGGQLQQAFNGLVAVLGGS
jgi:Flp pilus assembly pilin Flp